ncbi:hypothetical protein GPJ56_004255 [Histomonas meleagridis]|uniref:uncharacterized protein n=1 Tax=Histomonas meleagridis TaxID=135588 RepID=UPI00355A00A7|nr:hypothetical protein GPJ56_004255 [Histomonas meleagridis]KAH0800531.1 hypothetical protein GO595_006734 [Histomonas meleagridis]
MINENDSDFKKLPSHDEDEMTDAELRRAAMRISLEEIQSQIKNICTEITAVDKQIEEETKAQSLLQNLLESQQDILNLLLEENKNAENIPKPYIYSSGSIRKLKTLQEKYIEQQIQKTNESISFAKSLPSYQNIYQSRLAALYQFNNSLQQVDNLQSRRQSLLTRYNSLLESENEFSDVTFLIKSYENLTNEIEELQQKLSQRRSQTEHLTQLKTSLQSIDEEVSSLELIRDEVNAKEQEINEIRQNFRLHWNDRVYSQDAQYVDDDFASFYQDISVQTKSPRTIFASDDEIKEKIEKEKKKIKEIKAKQAHDNQVIINALRSWQMQIGVLEEEMKMTINYFEQLGKEFSNDEK